MKRLILSIAMVLVLVLMLAAPAFAAGTSTWYLHNVVITDQWGHPEKSMSTTQTQTGHVDIAGGGSVMWIADKIALAKVTFPNDAWVLRLATDTNWSSTCAPQIGYWDGTNFTALVGNPEVKFYASNFEVQLNFVPASGQVIPKDTYLAVLVTNIGNSTHPIYTGEKHDFTVSPPGAPIVDNSSWYYSCLLTPQSDPGYPLPELAAGVLLGAGILGLGGFMIIRRKNLAVKA